MSPRGYRELFAGAGRADAESDPARRKRRKRATDA
jgi:hypothetical protein